MLNFSKTHYYNSLLLSFAPSSLFKHAAAQKTITTTTWGRKLIRKTKQPDQQHDSCPSGHVCSCQYRFTRPRVESSSVRLYLRFDSVASSSFSACVLFRILFCAVPSSLPVYYTARTGARPCVCVCCFLAFLFRALSFLLNSAWFSPTPLHRARRPPAGTARPYSSVRVLLN